MTLRFLIPLLTSAAFCSSNAAAQGAAAFQKACARCHPAATVLVRKIKGASPEERQAYLAVLLKSHHPPDPATVDQVIGYILALPVK
jgi:hypothetical protein